MHYSPSAGRKQSKKRRAPPDAPAFRNRQAEKGLIWTHPKGNNAVTQLDVLMASKPFPESTVPELGPPEAAQKVFLKVTTHHLLGDDATGSSLWLNNRSNHTLCLQFIQAPHTHTLSPLSILTCPAGIKVRQKE